MNRRVIVTPLWLAALTALGWAAVAHAQWSACGVPLVTNSANQYLPAAVSDNAGGTIVAWADQRTKTATGTARWMIYAQRLDLLGMPQWAIDGIQVAPDTAVADSVFDQEYPAALADGSGGAYIAWVDKHSYPSTDLYMQHIDANGVPAWATSDGGLVVSRATYAQQSPTLIQDGAGGVIVVWQSSIGNNFDIYAQRLDASGTLQWGAGGVPVCTRPNGQFRPRGITDGVGGAIIVWYDERFIIGGFGGQDIFAQKLNGAGAPQWTLNGVAVYGSVSSGFTGDQRNPEIISDGAGGAIITCEDAHGVAGCANPCPSDRMFDISAQRLDATGAQQWTVNGSTVCLSNFDQKAPNLCTDGAGGAFIAWHDYRKGGNVDADVYAQRLNPLGVSQWTANGVPLITLAGHQLYPNIVSDGANGAIVTWYDERGVTPNLFAQRLNPAGAALWTANGVGICGTPYGLYAHSTIADGLGGAIIAWQDGRTTNTDIYAARVNGSGGLGAPVVVLGVEYTSAGGLVLGAPSPNPTRRAMTVRFVLPSAAPAALELIDVSGRLVEAHEVGGLGPGAHVLQLGRESAPHAGLYLVRLRQNGRSLIGKVSVVP